MSELGPRVKGAIGGGNAEGSADTRPRMESLKFCLAPFGDCLYMLYTYIYIYIYLYTCKILM